MDSNKNASNAHVCTNYRTPSEYIAGLPAWDGKLRLDTWLHRVFKTDCTPNTHDLAATARWFITDMVSRAMPPLFAANGTQLQGPGCKSPYLLLLAGPQGTGKSRALRALGGDWFGDTNVLDDYNPDQALEGVWLHEIAECSPHIYNSPHLKAFITQTHYQRRVPYTRDVVLTPRTVMLAATTGEIDLAVLAESRRIRPVQVTRETADIEWLLSNRDQLFAEAKAALEAALPGQQGASHAA